MLVKDEWVGLSHAVNYFKELSRLGFLEKVVQKNKS